MRLRPPGPRRLSRTDTNTQRATTRGAGSGDRRGRPGRGCHQGPRARSHPAVGGNNAAVRLPRRRFPGVLVQARMIWQRPVTRPAFA
ncbi:DUF6959 family protein [Streptomyces sp. NPDC003015]